MPSRAPTSEERLQLTSLASAASSVDDRPTRDKRGSKTLIACAMPPLHERITAVAEWLLRIATPNTARECFGQSDVAELTIWIATRRASASSSLRAFTCTYYLWPLSGLRRLGISPAALSILFRSR